MTRSWMLEVMETPVSHRKNDIATKPVSLNELRTKIITKPTSTDKLNSSAVLPNNALLKEPAPKIENYHNPIH